MSHYLKQRILQHVGHQAYRPQAARELAEAIGVGDDDYAAFAAAIHEMVDAGQVIVGVNDTVTLPPLGNEVVGKFKRHERGFGFIIPDTASSHGDLFVSPRDTLDALTGDRVRAEVVRSGRRNRTGKGGPTARIVEILQRGQTNFVGALAKKGGNWLVFPDGRLFTEPIVVRDASSKNAKQGDKVVVELTRYPEGHFMAEGVITEVLGEAGAPNVETLGVIRAYDLSEKLPEDALAEARDAVRDYNENTEDYFTDRTDLRDTFTLTIDPPDAKDFDDAISINRDGDQWELGIHIADVATFVRPGSTLDDEALSRGNSVYLPRLVLPMLPEVLSNGICSLQPGVPRLAKSVFITYDKAGKPLAARFANSVIKSDFRLTYLEAQALIDGDEKEATKNAVEDNAYSDELRQALGMMDELARTIRKRRFKEGMIVLDLPEVELVFDSDGRVIDAHPEDDAFTHRVIEMFMVEANEAVARAFADLDVPVIRRIHPDPGAHETGELRRFARVAGYNIPSNPTRAELQALLDATRGKPAAKAVHIAVLKTLTRAEYAPQLIGHFALASEHYLHFTSPIRRYTDLTAHRAVEALLERVGPAGELPTKNAERKKLGKALLEDDRCPNEDALTTAAKHCSTTERNAEAAERELRNLLVLQLMEQHVGETFEGTVTGVTSFGVYVQIDKYLVEGLIRCDNLPGAPAEMWRLNNATGAMTAQRSGRVLNIGHTVKVRVEKVDLSRREMDLRIVEDERFRHRKGQPREDKFAPKHKGGRRPKHNKNKHRGRRR